MNNKPILFSGEMVKAILEGRKTMTRRVMKPQPFEDKSYFGGFGWPHSKNSCVAVGAPHIGGYCPYGNWEGDLLWVRETWGYYGSIQTPAWVVYRADGDKSGIRWKPSIFMPRELSRITLQIVNVRVERIQDISEQDAEAEGAEKISMENDRYGEVPQFRTGFEHLWETINFSRGFGWNANPWVWVIEFKPLQKETL